MVLTLLAVVALAADPDDGGVRIVVPLPAEPTAPVVAPLPPPPTTAPAPVDAGVEEHKAEPVEPSVRLRGAAEAEAAVLPSGGQPEGIDTLLALRPVVGFAVGEDFSVELGPTFRLRVIDTGLQNRATDFSGVLRRPDWDEASDFGQIIQSLRIAPDSSPFFVRAGVVRKKTLGLGHLLNRYSNQENVDYHPAMGNVVLALGPFRGEFFASDVFGGRIFAGEAAWDLGRTFSREVEQRDRYVIAFQMAHDASRAGLPFRFDPATERVELPQVNLLHLDGSAMLLRSKTLRLMLLAGVGARLNEGSNDLGGVLGGALDADIAEISLSLKLEARKNAGRFRQGFFGPMYEVSRFADLGFSGTSQISTVLPDAFSFYGETRIGVGPHVAFDFAAEYFTYNRLDLDSTVTVNLIGSWLVGTARLTAIGVAQTPRFHLSGSLKWRLFRSLYVMGSGGTVFFPQPDGTLLRGVTISAGAGVDFER